MSKINEQYVKDLILSLEKNTKINKVAKLVKIFRILINQGNEKIVNDVKIEGNETFDIVLQFSFQFLPKYLKMINNTKSDEMVDKITQQKVMVIYKVFLTNQFKFMNAQQDSNMLHFVLKNAQNSIQLLKPFKQIAQKYFNFFVLQWAASDEIKVKLQAFIALKQFIIQHGNNSSGFRKVYLQFFKFTKVTNWRNFELINFMINSYNDLMQIDINEGYYILFTFLSQIARFLKTAMQEKTDESKRNIYNNQILNIIKLYVQIIVKNYEAYGELLYPLTEIIQGIFNFNPQKQYLPYLLQLINFQITICEKAKVYIPVLGNIQTLLDLSQFKKNMKKDSKKPYDFIINIKIDNKYLSSSVMWNQAFEMLIEYAIIFLSTQQNNLHYPEICISHINFIKKLQKQIKFVGYKKQIQDYMKLIQNHQQFIKNQRLNCKQTPQSNINEWIETQNKDQINEIEKKRTHILLEKQNYIKQRIQAEQEENDNQESEFEISSDESQENEIEQEQEEVSYDENPLDIDDRSYMQDQSEVDLSDIE